MATGIVLSLIGLGVADSMSPSLTIVPNTQSSQAQKLANAKFGPSQLVPILLEGPKAQLNKQGPRLVTALTKRPRTRVLSAWDAGTASAGLRPSPTAAMIVVSVDRAEKDVVKYDQPQLEKLVSQQLAGTQLKSYISGQPSVDRAIKDESINNLRNTQLIAVGILFVLLLVGLRAPVAALVVTAVGAVSTLAGFGEVAILGKVMTLDNVGVALGTMTGLALGVGFALLILDRFHREEWPDELHPRDAATAALRELEGTGRAVLVGGSALILALLLVAVVGPYELMVSLGTGMTVCAMFAVGGAVVVMPAAMVLLGRRIDWLSFPAPAFMQRGWSRLLDSGNWVTRHAVFLGFAATAVLAAMAVPAFALNSGAPSIKQLPSDSKARIAFEEISRVMGPGWPTPFNMIVVANKGTITEPAMLAAVNRLQRQIASDKRVENVTGPGTINLTAQQLKKFGPGLANSVKVSKKSKRDLLKLIDGLGQAGAGSAQLKAGLQQAVTGASLLNGGAGQAVAGAGKVHSGSSQLHAGSTQLSGGLNQALSGSQQLKAGAGQALSGATQLLAGIKLSQGPASQSLPALQAVSAAAKKLTGVVTTAKGNADRTTTAIAGALSRLESMTAGKSDPQYGAALDALRSASGSASTTASEIGAAGGDAAGVAGFSNALSEQAPGLVAGLNMLRAGADQLQSGIEQLRNGNAQLAGGMGQLSGGGQQLTNGLGLLTTGAGALEAGLGQLANGTGQLAYGLTAAPNGAGQLQTGLGLMQAGVVKARGQIPSTADLEKLFRESPGMFNSGYFVLAAVEGARGSDRNAASFVVNLNQGGTAGQIVIVSKYNANTPQTEGLRSHLASLGQTFGERHNAQVAIGGPAGNLGDLASVTKSKIWVDVTVLAVALTLVLMIGLRAVVLPIVATVFSLLVTAATFGVLQTLFGGSNPPLGGPGYLDPPSIIGIFTVAFGVSVIFATLLLFRTREAYLTETDGRSAVGIGLRETAAAATGAGLVMVAALVPFATTEFMYVRPFGVGVGVAILLDVLIMRPVLLPAAEAVFGRFGWWPTRGQRPTPPTRTERRWRLPHLHLPRRPRPAQL